MNTSIPVEFFSTSKGVLPSSAKLVASALRSNKNCTIWGCPAPGLTVDPMVDPMADAGDAGGSWKNAASIVKYPNIIQKASKSWKSTSGSSESIKMCSWKQVFQAISGPQLPSFLTVGWPRVVQHSGAPTNVLRSPYWEVWSPRSMIRTTNKSEKRLQQTTIVQHQRRSRCWWLIKVKTQCWPSSVVRTGFSLLFPTDGLCKVPRIGHLGHWVALGMPCWLWLRIWLAHAAHICTCPCALGPWGEFIRSLHAIALTYPDSTWLWWLWCLWAMD